MVDITGKTCYTIHLYTKGAIQMTPTMRAVKLQNAITLLEIANGLQQEALEGSDLSYDLHNGIEDLISQLGEVAEAL